MLTGIDILLDRMRNHPDEFLVDGRIPYEGEHFGGKWADLLDYAWRVANKDEREMLEEARREFYRDDFNERVMKRLAGEEEKYETLTYKPTGRYAGGFSDPRGAFSQAQASQLQQMQGLQNAALLGQAQIKTEGATISGSGGVLGLGKLF